MIINLYDFYFSCLLLFKGICYEITNISLSKNNYKFKSTCHDYRLFLKDIIFLPWSWLVIQLFLFFELNSPLMMKFLKLRMQIHT